MDDFTTWSCRVSPNTPFLWCWPCPKLHPQGELSLPNTGAHWSPLEPTGVSQIILDHRSQISARIFLDTRWSFNRRFTKKKVAGKMTGDNWRWLDSLVIVWWLPLSKQGHCLKVPKEHQRTTTDLRIDILQIYFKHTSNILQSNASQICFICFTCLFRNLQDMCYITFQRWAQLPDPPTFWLLLHPRWVASTFKLRMFNGFNGWADS